MGENQYIYTIIYFKELYNIIIIQSNIVMIINQYFIYICFIYIIFLYNFFKKQNFNLIYNLILELFIIILIFNLINLIFNNNILNIFNIILFSSIFIFKKYYWSIMWDYYILKILKKTSPNICNYLIKLIKFNNYLIPFKLIIKFYLIAFIDIYINIYKIIYRNLIIINSFNFKTNLLYKGKLQIKKRLLFYNYNSIRLIFKFFSYNFLIIYNFFKSVLISLICVLLYILFGFFFFQIQFIKQLSIWFVIGMLFFWLISGFNFFVKRYQFAKFTSQIQRFWKRTNIYFWLIEGFLILIYFYYFLNSSQEPIYMYDYSVLNQNYLVSLNSIFLNIIILSLIIYFMYYVLFSINYSYWNQLSLYIILISIFLFLTFFLETYQFYYVINSFNERIWLFNDEENLWQINIDNPILRVKQQYLLVCLIAKYWHFLFIFISWIFFIIKSFEKKYVSYILFSTNLQNIIILFILNFLCYLQWFKWVYRRFFDLPYNWFFINNDNKLIYKFLLEIKLIIINYCNNNISIINTNNTKIISLVLWNSDSIYFWKYI